MGRAASILLLAGSVLAQGNGRDAELLATITPASPAATPWSSAAIDLLTVSPGGTLAGMPFLLGADLITLASPPPIALPGEPDVVALTPACVILAGGFGPGAPLLPPVGFSLGLVLPPEGLPPGRLVFQAAVLDPGAPNGLAVTGTGSGSADLAPTLVARYGPFMPVLGQFGYALSVADLDGNGIDELIIGALQADFPVNDAGQAFVLSGFGATPIRTLNDPMPQSGAQFGCSTSTGDINGDGFLDIVVGARLHDLPGVLDAGKVVVFFGPTYTSTQVLFSPSPGFREQFGHWTTCGDFDGDGYADLAVSSIGATALGVPNAGVVRIFYGPGLGPYHTLFDPAPGLSERFGYRAEARDYDGDGFADLAVAATFKPLTIGQSDDSGAIWILRGPLFAVARYYPNPFPSASGLLGADIAWTDLNNDGFVDLVAGAELDSSGGLAQMGSVHVLFGPAFLVSQQIFSPLPLANEGFGAGVDGGDFDGDGFTDLMVGAFYYPVPFSQAGRTHVLYGPSFTQFLTFTEPIPGPSNQFGRRVRAARLDVGADHEIVIGVPFSSASGVSRSGTVYIGNL